jgi:nucleoside-diphosphate-sugar epimerase
VPRSVEQPQRTWSVNSTGAVRVLEAARKQWSKAMPPLARVVFAASSSAYGADPTLPKVETQATRPMSPYAASKLAGEHAMTAWAHSYGFSTASLRYFNIFGPRQSADSAYAAVIAAFTKKLLSGERPTIHGDGTQSRDFTAVGNAVCATLLAGAADRPLKGEVMNIGTGRRVTVRELCDLLAARCGARNIEPILGPVRAGDVPHSLADWSRAKELIGYRPITTLEEGLDDTVAWFKRELAAAGG